MRDPNRFWNPYLAGAALGLVLLSAYVLLDKGLGASGASWHVGVAALNAVAPGHVEAAPAMARTVARGGLLDDWLVYEVLGVALGGLVGAYTAGRLGREVLRGPNVSVRSRLGLALAGGVLMGLAARMARGCTSGQALSGGALLSVGSWAFMLSVFAGGYAAIRLVRRTWR
jgi:hypothetical protein